MQQLYVGAAVLALVCSLHQAQAQNMWNSNNQFDRGIDELVARQERALAAQQQQIRAAQMQAFGPQLFQAWRRSGLDRVMSFEQYRYQMLITANGTDIAGGTEALRRQYLGNQLANQTLRDAGEIYRNGMYESSERQGAAVNRSTEQAIRGQGVYVDAYGNAVRLPNYAPGQRFPGPNGARYSQGADGYWRDQYGNFLNPR